MQQYDGGYRYPGYSVYKEYYAISAEYYAYMMPGRTDLKSDQLFNSQGYFDTSLLWKVIKATYGEECPDDYPIQRLSWLTARVLKSSGAARTARSCRTGPERKPR